MRFKMMFFDLDDTLYPPSTGIWEAVGDRMDRFMIEELGFQKDKVVDLRQELFREYGTTFRGLQMVYNVDSDHFLNYVHDIPLQDFLQKDEPLDTVLSQYFQPKSIFTNANLIHAQRVLSTLGLDHHFEQIIDIVQVSPYCKPMPESFEKALQIAGVADASDCVMIDDSARNLESAKKMGFFTVHVGSASPSDFANASILSLHELPSVIPLNGDSI